MTVTTASTVVEFGFGYGALVDLTDGQWTSVTATKVQRIAVDRGRQSELDTFSAGTCTITLEDPNSRQFDPQNTAGPYYGNLVPGVQVRVRALVSGNYYPVFRGHVVAWRQQYSKNLGTVAVSCVDATRLLSNARLDLTVYETVVLARSPHVFWRLGETGETAADSSGNRHDGTYSSSAGTGSSTVRPFGEGAVATNGTVPVVRSKDSGATHNTPLTVEIWVKADTLTASTVPLIATQIAPTSGVIDTWKVAFIQSSSELLTLNSGTGLAWTTPEVIDGLPHHVVVVFDAGSTTVYVDGHAATSRVQGASINVGGQGVYLGAVVSSSTDTTFPGSFDDFAIYGSALSSAAVLENYEAAVAPWDGDTTGTRIGRILDQIGWPAGLRSIDTGEAILGPADIANRSTWDYMQSVAQSEGGRLFISRDGKVTFHQADRFITNSVETTSQYTFSDDGAGDSVYGGLTFSLDDTFLYNGAQVTRDGGLPQTADDSTSVSNYGPRTRTLSGLLFRTDAQSRGLAERIVFLYKNPRTRASDWTSQPEVDAANWPSILGLEIGHRVTVESKPANVGTQIAVDLHLEKFTHTIDGNGWSITFAGSPVDSNVYFTWGGDGATQGWGNGVWR